MSDHVMSYIESSAPAGQTLIEWRRTRVAATSRRRRLGLRTVLPGALRPRVAI
jgi:hypothetical protein